MRCTSAAFDPGPPFQTNVSGRHDLAWRTVERVRHEEHLAVDVASLVVADRDTSGTGGVLQRLAVDVQRRGGVVTIDSSCARAGRGHVIPSADHQSERGEER